MPNLMVNEKNECWLRLLENSISEFSIEILHKKAKG